MTQRYVVAVLSLWACLQAYAIRTNIAVALLYIPNVSETSAGSLLSAFFLGYLCTQVLGGWSASRIGAKPVLIVGALVWTLGDVAATSVYFSPGLLFLSRVVVGLGQTVLFPCVSNLAALWFPRDEKSFLTTLSYSGMDLGSILSLSLDPIIAKRFGWQFIFIGWAGVTIAWISVLLAFAPASAKQDQLVRHENTSQSESRTPWLKLLTKVPFLAIFSAHFSMNYSWYLLLSWIPTYIQKELHIDLKSNAFLAALPYISSFAGFLICGRISDLMFRKNIKLVYIRKIMNSMGLLVPAVSLMVLSTTSDAQIAVTLLCVTLFFARSTGSGYLVNIVDVAPRFSGQLMGISNTIGTVPGIVSNLATGYILEKTHSWRLVFSIAAVVNVIGAVIFALFASADDQFEPEGLDQDETREPLNHRMTDCSKINLSPS